TLMRTWLLPLIIGCVLAAPLQAQSRPGAGDEPPLGLWATPVPPLVAELRQGIDAYYRFDYDGAIRRFDRLVTARPDHPAGYFLRAEAYWWLFLNDRRNAGARQGLQTNLTAAIARGEARLAAHPDDVEALFILGSAHGRKGMLAGTAKDAWQAARSAQRAKGYLTRVRALAPEIADAAAAEGLYQYYVGTFGSVARTASRVLFGLRGDKAAGLAALDAARRRGAYTRTEAAFFQALFYLQFEQRPADAQPILDGLRSRYPENLYFATMAAYARQRQRQYAAARPLYESTLARLAATRVYGREGETLTRFFYGQTLLGLGELAGAEAQFTRVAQIRATESDAYPHTSLFLGRIADLRGHRTLAISHYRRVLTFRDVADSHDLARRLIDRPFTPAALPALISAPLR
ncbi:MAG: hypothetical protein ABR559_03370, partial [Gemmatimonadota bacterium]